MKNIVMVINTYYQMILAMQMKNTVFSEDYVDVLISDRSRGAKDVCKRLEELMIYDNCSFIESKFFDSNINLKQKVLDCFQMGFCKKNRYSVFLEKCKMPYYDEFMFFNEDYMEIDGIFSTLSVKNKKLAISMFEEGLLTYHVGLSKNKRRRLLETIRKLKKYSQLTGQKYNFYCYYPELYSGTGFAQKVPLITSNCKTAEQLKQLFHPALSEYNRKYIFFTSVYDFEGGEPIGEYELVVKVAELVGKDNLLVKTHPRDTRTIYVDNGFNVDKNSIIPWEAIQLSGDFSDKVFLSINSCSVLAGSTMAEQPVKTYYLYKLCDISGNNSCIKNARDVEYLLNQSSLQQTFKMVKVADKLADILL